MENLLKISNFDITKSINAIPKLKYRTLLKVKKSIHPL